MVSGGKAMNSKEGFPEKRKVMQSHLKTSKKRAQGSE